MLRDVWRSPSFSVAPSSASALTRSATPEAALVASSRAVLWYGGVAFGVLATAAVSAILWKRRLRALDLQVSPLERAEQLIESCESKLESIESAVAELKASR